VDATLCAAARAVLFSSFCDSETWTLFVSSLRVCMLWDEKWPLFPTVQLSRFSVFTIFWRTVSLWMGSDDEMTCWFAFCMVIAVLLIIFIISMVWTVSLSLISYLALRLMSNHVFF